MDSATAKFVLMSPFPNQNRVGVDKPEFDFDNYNAAIKKLARSLNQGGLNEQDIKKVEDKLLTAMKENPGNSLIPYTLSRLYLLEAKFRKTQGYDQAGVVATEKAFEFHREASNAETYGNSRQKFEHSYWSALHLSPYGPQVAKEKGLNSFPDSVLSYLYELKRLPSGTGANEPATQAELLDQGANLLNEPYPPACYERARVEIKSFESFVALGLSDFPSVDSLICAAELLEIVMNSPHPDAAVLKTGSGELIGKCYDFAIQLMHQGSSSAYISGALKVLTIIAPHHPKSACLLGILGINQHRINKSLITSVTNLFSSACLLVTDSQIKQDKTGFLNQVYDVVVRVAADQNIEKPELNKSIQYLIDAAHNENVFAQAQLQQLIEQHPATLLSADKETLFSLGQICNEGKLIPKNITQSVLFFKQAADHGHAQAAFLSSETYAQQGDINNSMRYLVLAIQNNIGNQRVIQLDKKQQEFNRKIHACIVNLLNFNSEKVIKNSCFGDQCFELSQWFKKIWADPDQTDIYLKMAAKNGHKEAAAVLKKLEAKDEKVARSAFTLDPDDDNYLTMVAEKGDKDAEAKLKKLEAKNKKEKNALERAEDDKL